MDPADAALYNTIRSGGSWFFWIAGLSLINSIATHSGSQFSFVVGLGFTMIVDTVLNAAGTIGQLVAVAIDAAVLGTFVLFGVFARRGHIWAFVCGFILYTLDALIFVLLPDEIDILPVAFHGFVLFCLWNGLMAARRVKVQLAAAAAAPVV